MKKFFYILGQCILCLSFLVGGAKFVEKMISHYKLQPITDQVAFDLSYLAEESGFNPTKKWINQYIDELYNANIIRDKEGFRIRIIEYKDMYSIDVNYSISTQVFYLHASSSYKGYLANPVSRNITVSNDEEEAFYGDDSGNTVYVPLESTETFGDAPSNSLNSQISVDDLLSITDEEDPPGSDYFSLKNSLPLLEAVYDSDKEQVLKLLKKTDINIQDERGFTPLMIAVRVWDTDMVKLLLNKGADTNLTDEDGWTALMLAAAEHNSSFVDSPVDGDSNLYEMIEYILDSGADPNITNNDGYTALMWAAHSNDVRIVKLLLDHSAIPNMVAYDGYTAMKNAQMVGNKSIQSLLIQAGVNE